MLKGKSIVVFDCEIKNPIEKLSKGWASKDEMGVSCMVCFDYKEMRYRVFDDKNIMEGLKLIFLRDIVVGFNTVKFDWPLIMVTYPEEIATLLEMAPRMSKDFDILREIWIALGLNPDGFSKAHGGYKLDDVARETIGISKSGNGAHAPVLYQEGKIAELFDYCIQDVNVEKTLFEYVMENGHVIRNGKQIEIKKERLEWLNNLK